MEDPVFTTLLDLCMSFGNLTTHRVLNEEEALCYQQACRTVTAVCKAREQSIEVSLQELSEREADGR